MIKRLNPTYRDIITIVLLATFFFIGLGHVHLFDWDEINFAESAREMLATGNYLSVQINYIPFWEKPPLFFWMQALSMKVFGVNEFAARFPNAAFGLIYFLTLYVIGNRLTGNRRFALLWILLYFGSWLPHIYFKSGIIDPVFNYFIFMSVYLVYRSLEAGGQGFKFPLLAGIFSGLSFLTKGPVGLLLLLGTIGLAVLILMVGRTRNIKSEADDVPVKKWIEVLRLHATWISIGFFALGFSGLVSIWLGAEVYYHGFDILSRFVQYQIELFTSPVAGHGQPFYYHFIVVFFGCFPMSVFAIPKLIPSKTGGNDRFQTWMIALFWVVMIIFSISTTKIVHYSSMTYLPLSFLAAMYLHEKINAGLGLNKFIVSIYSVIGLLWSILLIALFYLIHHVELILPYMHDEAAKDALTMPAEWTGYEPFIGIFFLGGLFYSLHLFYRKKIEIGVWNFSIVFGITLLLISIMILPGIEKITQGSAVEFYKSLEKEDVYVETIGFKSYAPYYYKKIQPDKNPKSTDKSWLLEGDIDKDVYLVTKIYNKELDGVEGIEKLKCEGGFCFYIRRRGSQLR